MRKIWTSTVGHLLKRYVESEAAGSLVCVDASRGLRVIWRRSRRPGSDSSDKKQGMYGDFASKAAGSCAYAETYRGVYGDSESEGAGSFVYVDAYRCMCGDLGPQQTPRVGQLRQI